MGKRKAKRKQNTTRSRRFRSLRCLAKPVLGATPDPDFVSDENGTTVPSVETMDAQYEINISHSTMASPSSKNPDRPVRRIPTRSIELPDLKGRRIFTIEAVNDIVSKSVSYTKVCKLGDLCDLKLSSETRAGFSSKLQFSCSCGFSVKQGNDAGRVTIPINDSSVWASHSSGIGFATLKSIMNIMEIPIMTFKTYQACENRILKLFEKARMDHMLENGRAEFEASREAKDIVIIDGKEQVCTTVQVDGGWSKRSYGHSYNANSGVAVIIGMRTKKILWMSTRNRDCFQCTINAKFGKVKEHECYKNWSRSSSSMETDIILEGFRSSIEMHGLIYRRMIGDGDSSVFADVEYVYKGLKVEKIECVNHFIKNLTSKIYKIAGNKLTTKNAPKIPKHEQNIISAHREQITIGVRKAIEYNSKNRPVTSVQTLMVDLDNVLNHVFGDHRICKSYFCKKQTIGNPMDKIKKAAFYRPLCDAINRGVTLSTRLIHNCVSNDAEHFMALCCKFTSGKRVYYSRRGGYNMRMISAMFCYGEGNFWADKMYRTIYGSSPTTPWRNCRIISQRLKDKIHPVQQNRAKRKLFNQKSKSDDKTEYGPSSRDGDIEESIMLQQIDKLYTKLQVDLETQRAIESDTRQQSESQLWFDTRRNRITASNAKRIYRIQDSTNNKSLLDSLLYPANIEHVEAIRYGKMNEMRAIHKYEKMTDTIVTRCGIFVSLENGIFAASPDGLVGEDGLVEVKCPYVLKDRDPSEYESCSGKSPFLKRSKISGKYEVVKSHQYYFQIIMMLHVTQRAWCDLVVWSHGPIEQSLDTGLTSPKEKDGLALILRILRDKHSTSTWEKMSPKLLKFWFEEIAPEIIDPRKVRGQEYRQPEFRLFAINKRRELRLGAKSTVASEDHEDQPFNTGSSITISTIPSSSRLTTIGYIPEPTVYEDDSD